MKVISILSLLTVFLFQTSFSQNKNDDKEVLSQFKYTENIVYKTVNGKQLKLTIFFPKERKFKKTPIMLYTHGGGWAGGNMYAILKSNFLETLKILTEKGIACATVEYRMLRPGVSSVADCVIDCKDAARFLVKNADKYGFDIEKMGLWGGSAGGHLSLLTALANNEDFLGDESLKSVVPKFQCIASYYPLTTFFEPEKLLKGSKFTEPEFYERMLGGTLEEKKDYAHLLSPVEYVTKKSPPILLLHGDKDITLPIMQSEYFLSVAKEKGANVELFTVKDAGHSFSGKQISPSMSEINQKAADFILKHLSK
ncbi:Esterase/lipase-like protein [Arcticibacter svalbardensis MN12-7]|uniref:Esterase/lipase-like protein n=1 Tax=Arcticibacter svalbardensis MN12-7 TaxID=1150600 RepID=R9GSD1_9SPHI|nr:prolyl oligopeptidase family serine peptidase [Arcticibacter svalbardensis]EOR94616.1 Esterase/lipase-like protein [Arcticibacter svalbardensis MN12-7]